MSLKDQKLIGKPLKFALAEFKFSPILQLSIYIPDLQEAYRKDFPSFDTKSEQVFKLSNHGNLEPIESKRWSFIASDKKSAIEIDNERIVFFLSSYESFKVFSQKCKATLDTLNKILEPSLIQRIGLRYCNLVTINDNKNPDKYVIPSLTCPEQLVTFGKDRQQRNETVIDTKSGTLVIRSYYGKHNLTMPPDLINRLPINIDMDNSTSERIIIDIDHFWEAKESSQQFDLDPINEKLSALHDIISEAFCCLTTDVVRGGK